MDFEEVKVKTAAKVDPELAARAAETKRMLQLVQLGGPGRSGMAATSLTASSPRNSANAADTEPRLCTSCRAYRDETVLCFQCSDVFCRSCTQEVTDDDDDDATYYCRDCF